MTQEVLKFTKAITEPNTITFHNSNADWVMRITTDRRIEVNEDVEVTEAAQKVLDAMQYLLKEQTQEPFCLHWEDRWGCNHYADPKEPHPVNAKPLYTTTPRRTWVGLTDKERETATGWSVEHIESYLKQKNGYAEEKNT